MLTDMNANVWKYFSVLTAPLVAFVSLTYNGIWAWATIIYVFIVIVLLELILPQSQQNFDKAEEQIHKADPVYDYLLYMIVPIQYSMLIYFLFQIQDPTLTGWDKAGKILTLGIGCGVFGINVAHELGHRHTKHEQFMAKALLLTSLYMQFFIEHNRGHHRNVSTPDDPASSRYGETVYAFYFRSIVMGYISAWNLERERLAKEGKPFISLQNEMVRFTLIELMFLITIYIFFGLTVMLYFCLCATIGFLLLETVNYIEHYGLQRKKIGEKAYEKVMPIHSWNSNHYIGRIVLFELTRHSDHHYNPSRKYQVLRHFDESPQLPTGYPGMVLLALFPPLWFFVMHRQIDKLRAENRDGLALA